MQIIRAVGAAIRAVEVVVAVAVEGAAESLRVGEVDARRPYGQAHPPIANIGPNKGPGGKDQLQEESHTQQLVNRKSSCSEGRHSDPNGADDGCYKGRDPSQRFHEF